MSDQIEKILLRYDGSETAGEQIAKLVDIVNVLIDHIEALEKQVFCSCFAPDLPIGGDVCEYCGKKVRTP